MKTNQMKKILFTGGGGAGNEAIWNILKEKYQLCFADCNIKNIDPSMPDNIKINIPMANSPNFLETVIKISKELELDFLVPGVDEELLVLSKNKNLFNCHILLPDHSFVSNMLDKYSCANSIIEKELSAPKTFYVNDWEKLDFPMIIKPKSGRGSRGVMTISSKEELDAYRVFYNTPNSELIVQELIQGQEFTVLVSADNDKKLNCIVPVKVIQKKGITISAIIDNNEAIVKYAKMFHEAFTTTGIYNIQCILTKNGEVFPFEVNPRISTTFCMALAVGFDPFELYKNRKSKELITFHDTISLKRSWRNNFSRIVN